MSAALALLSPLPVRAQVQERDPAAAQALFNQARQLVQQGKPRAACPKFVESNRLDPGIGTQFNLADCYERSGKLASAWATFLEVASIANASGQPDREKAATKRASQLEARLPTLTVAVPEANRVEGLEVRRTSVEPTAAADRAGSPASSAELQRTLIAAAQWGTAVPVDPGDYVLTISAPGRTLQQHTITLEEGKPTLFEVPALAVEEKPLPPPAPVAVAPAAVPAPAAPPAPPKPEPTKQQPAAKSQSHLLPLVLAGAGVVGLGVGTVFALKAKSSNDDSKHDCGTPNINVCGPEGLDKRNDALHQGNIATASFIAGGAFLASALIVWRVEAGSKKTNAAQRPSFQPRAAVAPGTAALYLQGSF